MTCQGLKDHGIARRLFRIINPTALEQHATRERLERSHVVECSLGGSTGIGIAIEHPQRIVGLSGADCRSWSPNPSVWDTRVAGVVAGGMDAAVCLQRTYDGFRGRPMIASPLRMAPGETVGASRPSEGAISMLGVCLRPTIEANLRAPPEA